MKHRPSSPRRTAAQWADLLSQWDPQTTSAAEFARRLGVSRQTLDWWRWRLKPASRPDTSPPAPLRLVPVEVLPDDVPADDASDWVLTTADGHTLRVRGSIPAPTLRVLLEHLTRRSSP